MNARTIKLIECPRDAMQGWEHQIPTEKKIAYLSQLLQVGFDSLDFGSFVSPKAIPQLADTNDVVRQLDTANSKTKLLAIIANTRGAQDACQHPGIRYLGFPFSVSPTFQMRNTNSSIEQSLERVSEIQELCTKQQKELVIYISMGFGNPYGDPYDPEIVWHWIRELIALDIRIISLADTVGLAAPEQVFALFDQLAKQVPAQVETGVHLHARPGEWKEKISAALEAGCLRFDAALKGIGGCPMSGDALVGNIPMEKLITYLESAGYETGLDHTALSASLEMAATVFN